jgi:colanic acid/amylovoran biosynthesis protein
MIVELFGYQNVNKGQEIMFHACREFLANEGIDGAVSITSGSFKIHNHIRVQKQYGLAHLVHVHGDRYPKLTALINATARSLPSGLKRKLNIVTRDDVDAIFDFSGFQYSDQWGPKPAELAVRSVQCFRPKGKKFIYLPQSFGPFENATIRKNMQIIMDGADLVFARETESYRHLISVCGERDTIRIAPDFSNLVKPIEVNHPVFSQCTVLIVPNARMLQKTDPKCRSAYIPFLAKCARFARKRNLAPAILLHEAIEDISIAKALISEAGFRIPIISHRDPRVLKGYIKKAFLLIGSRYHALVGGLSQAVPTIATGWTHKYKALMELYRCPDSMISPLDPDASMSDTIDAHIEDTSRAEILLRLKSSAANHMEASQRMWEDIRKTLYAKN